MDVIAQTLIVVSLLCIVILLIDIDNKLDRPKNK
jgi:hypothetical protein